MYIGQTICYKYENLLLQTSIFMPLLMMSNMDKFYPEAEKFIPERWLKNDPQLSKRAHPFVTMPFGFGPRMCVGRRFAELEIETLVTKVC
jgi:cytochrome P450